jgi:mRNA-degrading endonuclease YafQ of YafQ-DinJ toxin-antitoxin module
MLELIVTNKFKKDLKRIRKQGKDLNLLQDVLQTLLEASGRS